MWEMVQDGVKSKCWIDLSDVPKVKTRGKGYDWKNSIGCKIGVKYKWCNDEMEEYLFEIVDYDKTTKKLTLKWNENECQQINASSLLKGKFGSIFGKVDLKFKYEIGQIVNGLTIIDRYYKKDKKGQLCKWYKYQCEKGHVYKIVENALKRGQGCSICSGRTVSEGYNDLATTHPDLVPYFPNPDDAKKYIAQSHKKVTLKCPLCGKEKTMIIFDFIRYGFSCPNCSDGVPLTEKFMSNLLFSKNIEYITQATKNNFDWIKDNRRYDFALPLYKTMIEIDGDPRSHGDRKNDDYKNEMTLNNGWNMIRINLLENYTGSFEQLWSAYKLVLNDLDIHIMDEEAKECYIKSQTSIFNLVVEIANNNPELSQQKIANKLKEKYGYQLCKSSIGYYLKKSNELGLTNYKNKHKRAVIGINMKNPTIIIEYSLTSQAKKDGFDNRNIWSCCKGKVKSYKGYYWCYKDDYEKFITELLEGLK